MRSHYIEVENRAVWIFVRYIIYSVLDVLLIAKGFYSKVKIKLIFCRGTWTLAVNVSKIRITGLSIGLIIMARSF